MTPDDKSRSVPIYFSALDDKGKTVSDLKVDEVKLTVDGVPQKIDKFTGPDGAAPLTFELLLDVSGSRENELPGLEQRYARAMFAALLRPGDRAYVREFAVSNRLLTSASSDPATLAAAVSHESRPRNQTALLQAIYDACTQDLSNGGGRNAILLISDGGENASEVPLKEVEGCLRRENVVVYAAGTFNAIDVRKGLVSRLPGPSVLGQLTEDFGGGAWLVKDEKEFGVALGAIVELIRGQYTIAFAGPGPKPSGKPHKIELKTSRKGITLFAPEDMPDGEPIGP